MIIKIFNHRLWPTNTHQHRLSALIISILWTSAASAQTQDWIEAFNIQHLPAYMTAALIIAVCIMLFYNRLFYFKEKQLTNESKQMNAQMALVLDSNKTQVWTYNVKQRVFNRLSEQGTMEEEYSPIDFQQFYENDDFAQVRQTLKNVTQEKALSESTQIRGRAPKEQDKEQKLYDINISVLRRDKNNRPSVLLGIQRDITEESQRQQRTSKLLLQFHTVFNSSQVDMIYYDANGIMIDINDAACESFKVPDRSRLLAMHSSLHDAPTMRDINLLELEEIYSSSITQTDEVERPIGGIDQKDWGHKIYYEHSLTPIRNQMGQLTGIVMAGRNITEMVNSHHQQQHDSRLLQRKIEEITAYIDNINFALKVSQVQLVNYYPDTHEIDISDNLNKTQIHIPSLRAITFTKHEEWRKVKGLFRRMDCHREGTFSQTFHTVFHDQKGRDVYLNFHMMPIHDAKGRITHYFGVCRNDTEAVYTEIRLKEETLKAQETEMLKDTFLLNMSYELRTPLNTLIGFAELFASDHAEEDETMFAEEIKHSTNELLLLVNDILFISRLDAHMMEYNFKESDFAMLFESFCYQGLTTVESGVNIIVENPYSHLMVAIDEEYLGMVISKLCQNSSRFTHKGSIRCKYEYHHGELAISIEDTGGGIDPETLTTVFERFGRNKYGQTCGTGLDLPIVKVLIEQMGGTIELQSEEEKGTTAYVVIPCEMTAMEKKTEAE